MLMINAATVQEPLNFYCVQQRDRLMFSMSASSGAVSLIDIARWWPLLPSQRLIAMFFNQLNRCCNNECDDIYNYRQRDLNPDSQVGKLNTKWTSIQAEDGVQNKKKSMKYRLKLNSQDLKCKKVTHREDNRCWVNDRGEESTMYTLKVNQGRAWVKLDKAETNQHNVKGGSKTKHIAQEWMTGAVDIKELDTGNLGN